MATQVIVVGSYNQDHVWQVDRFPQPGETRRGSGFRTGPGGKGFNQAVACARQDVATVFIGARGKDALGEGAAALAEREGLMGCWQVREDVPTGTAAILVEASGQNQIIVDLAANERLDPDFLRAQSTRFADARVLLVQLENNLDATRAALELGGEHNLTCVLNPAPVHPDLDAGLLGLVDVLTPNESEFAQLCARFLDAEVATDDVASLDDERLHALCRRLCNGSVVVTLGRHGSFVSHGAARRGDEADCYRVAAETVTPVDTTGAGDAFCGALAAGLASTDSARFADAVRQAGRVAAMSTERAGAAVAMPRRDEVAARFR
ncbi:ribokinase [Oleiagrimonas citrea]|uniref:Ribokinase n=1 Tax=Oleiagrimonas citrea TaxID=1665687 RepID=A0A846ZPS1_9GAMM|nr:ribokinase [Oleiagrimonas citrea]NKZ39499.1 ribokinase [Oleiagrimonas citrea]